MMHAGRVLIRRPGPRLAEGLVTHIDRVDIDPDLAADQWQGYVDALVTAGYQAIEVAGADDCPDAVFIEDVVVMFGQRAVITLPGAASRLGETAAIEDELLRLSIPFDRVEAPGTLDGGDVLKVGHSVYVGLSGRTNAPGIAQLAQFVSPHGYLVKPVRLTKVLHLKSAVTALPDGTIIGYPPLVDDPGVFDRFLAVPEASGAHVVLLDDTRLLMSDSAPLTAELLRSRGYDPVGVPISEFEKLEGCVTCLSVRLRD